MSNRTEKIGVKTGKVRKLHSRTAIFGKDPRFDYAFKLKSKMEENGQQGWDEVNSTNIDKEVWGGVSAFKPRKTQKTGGAKQFCIEDTILCKRDKEISEIFKQEEDEKYNSQMRLIRDAAPNARIRARNANLEGEITDRSSIPKGRRYSQQPGPTEG